MADVLHCCVVEIHFHIYKICCNDIYLIGNHKGIAKSLGLQVCEYRYWDDVQKRLDIEGMLADLSVRTLEFPAFIIIILIYHDFVSLSMMNRFMFHSIKHISIFL